MAIYNKESRLSEILMTYPSLIPVANRLGISLGVGDRSVAEVCSVGGNDSGFVLSVINTYIDDRYFPSNPHNTFTLEKTIDYLEKTNKFYLSSQLPNIERHFSSLISRSGEDNNLNLLLRFFTEAGNQLKDIISYDTVILFPGLREGKTPEGYADNRNIHAEVEEKLHDLLYFFVAHLHGSYDHNLSVAVVSAVFALEKDIRQNNRIRERILLPIIDGMSELAKNFRSDECNC